MTGSAIARVLGDAFDHLPVEVRTAHGGETLLLAGRANADIGPGWVTALIRGLFGFPRSGRDMPVTIAFSTDAKGRDSWQRDFDGRKYSSTMEAGSARYAGLLVERQQLFTWVFRLTVENDQLILELVSSAILGIAQPRWLAPRCLAFETGAAGKFTFDITVDLPIFGRLIRYWGAMDLPAAGDRG